MQDLIANKLPMTLKVVTYATPLSEPVLSNRSVTDLQLKLLIPTDHNIDATLQRSEFFRNTLPSIPTHDHAIGAAFRSIRCDLSKVGHLFGKTPW